MTAYRFVPIFVLVVLLSSCGDLLVYEKSYSFENHTWSQRVKPVFKFPIMDTSKQYDFLLTLRTTTDYKYNNLWIYLNTKTPGGQTAREPFEIKIANPDGTWIGKKNRLHCRKCFIF